MQTPVEKNGIRNIEHLTGHHQDTIGTLLEDIAEHATEASDDYLLQNVGLSQFECDERGRLLKKEKRLSEAACLSLKTVTPASTPP